MERLKMQSRDVIGSNIQKIAQLFPQCITERLGKDGKPEFAIDFEKLQAELSNELIGEGEERYQFTWPDKRAAARLANTPTTMTLRPCRAESVDFDHTQNLYIEGDNLDVLKVLRETYLGKVKMIYIDPPYNTGNDFVYNDDFVESYDEFAESCKVRDEDGNLQFNPKANGESNGRFHTDWLNMMYPRLKVAKDLLTDDGVIFISIDDNEVENLRKVCDEIFGESNFVANLIWANKEGGGSSDSKLFRIKNEHILCFTRNKELVEIKGIPITNKERYKGIDEYYNVRGAFYLQKLGMGSIQYSASLDYEIICPDGSTIKPADNNNGKKACWRWSKEKYDKNKNAGFVEIKKDMNNIWTVYTKQYMNCDNDGNIIERTQRPMGIIEEYSSTQAAKLLKCMDIPFDYSKPIELIKYLLDRYNDQDSLILDFFSGSATTAHAVMQLNVEDGGHRKFIMVQLPELTDEKSEAYKAGYKNICEIGKERIRRAGAKIRNEQLGMRNGQSSLFENNASSLDTGFRVLKLDSSNMEDVYYTPEEFNTQMLFQENVKADRTEEDLLFQVMLELGIELSASIRKERLEAQAATVFNVDNSYLMATFAQNIDEATITEIAKRRPAFFVMRDASAASDNVMDNFEQLFRHYSPETSCRVI